MFYKLPKGNRVFNLEHVTRIQYTTREQQFYTEPELDAVTVYVVGLTFVDGQTDGMTLDQNQFASFLEVLNTYNLSKYGLEQVK